MNKDTYKRYKEVEAIAYHGIVALNKIRQSNMPKGAIIDYAERMYNRLIKIENNLTQSKELKTKEENNGN